MSYEKNCAGFIIYVVILSYIIDSLQQHIPVVSTCAAAHFLWFQKNVLLQKCAANFNRVWSTTLRHKELTAKLTSRYLSSIVTNSLPNNWSPETVIIDAMFLINTRPLRRNTTIATYSVFIASLRLSTLYSRIIRSSPNL